MDQNLDTDAVTLTKTLCGHLAAAQFGDLTPAAAREARRGVLDWIGCALAGSGHSTITKLLDVLQETSGRPQATVFGRKLRLGLLDAPLANGQMGHLLDYEKRLCPHLQRYRRPEQLTAGLGRSWVIETNGHKPYACGVVLHPLIDAVIAIRNRDKIDPATVGEIGLRVHPLVLSITGIVEPATGLQSKFSTLHSAATMFISSTPAARRTIP